MSMEIPSIKDLKIRQEILDEKYEYAINIARIARGDGAKFLIDPVEFFKRTHVTESMRELVIKTLMALIGKTKLEINGKKYIMNSKLIVLPSLFGGGKSHSLAVLYHVLSIIRNIDSKDKACEIISVLDNEVAELVYKYWDELKKIGINIVVVHGGSRDFAPAPSDNMSIKTIWGYIAQQLGRYSVMAKYDKNIAPPKEAIKEVLDDSDAVVLIDEILRYYSRGLDKNAINVFLMNLVEVLTEEDIRRCVVIITLPYDVKTQKVQAVHEKTIDPNILKQIVNRAGVNVIPVVSSKDLPSILRKRIFDEDEEVLKEYGRILAVKMYERACEKAKEYIRKMGGLDELKKELERTYPFHPETINVLKLLHLHLSEYLQETRNAIRMAVEAVLAIRNGLYDWLGYTPYMVMPYHIPIIMEKSLEELLPIRTTELSVFKYILESDVVQPIKSSNEHVALGKNIKKKIPEEYHVPSFMITAYVWLRSLAGGGLLSKIEVYPTTDNIAFALMDLETVDNIEWMDVPKILKELHGNLYYLFEHSGRWLFRRVPLLEVLIKRYAEDITLAEIHNELYRYFEGLDGRGKKNLYKVDALADAEIIYIKYGEDAKLPDTLDINKPAIVVFTRRASDEEVLGVLERNNVVVLKPDDKRKIKDEDLKAKPELKKYETYWDALIDVLRYICACDKVTDEVLRTEYAEEVQKAGEIFALLRKKRDQIRKEYDELRSFLIPRVYHAVYIRRAGQIIPLEDLAIKSEVPLKYAVEVVLENNHYLKKELSGRELEEIIKRYLEIDIRSIKQGVSISDIWNFFLTSDTIKELPLIPYKALVNAVSDMVMGLDFGVRYGSTLYWKTVYDSEEDAKWVISQYGMDVGYETVKKLSKFMMQMQITGQKGRLVYWEFIVDDWLKMLRPKYGYRIVALLPSGKKKSLEELKTEYNWKDTLKKSALFYEKLLVDVEINAPKQVSVGDEIEIGVKVSSRTYSGVVKVVIDTPLSVDVKEFVAELPVEKTIRAVVPEGIVSGAVSVAVTVYSEKGERLGGAVYVIKIVGEEKEVERRWVEKRNVVKLRQDGKLVKVYGVRSYNVGDLVILTGLLSGVRARLNLLMNVSGIGGQEGRAVFKVEGITMEQVPIVQSYIFGLSNLGEVDDVVMEIKFEEPLAVDSIELDEYPEGVEFDVEYRVE